MKVPLKSAWLAAAATALGIVGCASKQEPAENLVQSAESALAEIRADAAKYAPDQLQKAEASLATAKERLAKEQYKEVIEGGNALATEVNGLKEVVIAKQTQLAAATLEWERLKKEVPPLLTSIENQLVNLKGRKLPPEVTKQSFDTAKTELETMKAAWTEATAAADAGDAAAAADKGRAVETKAHEIGPTLGMI
jgi:hypothetical protein